MALKLNDKSQFPILIIGDAVLAFKKFYNQPISYVNNLNDLRDLIAYYSGMECLDKIIVIDDISKLHRDAEGILLKFIEDTKSRIILLSQFDVCSSIILSRCKNIIKKVDTKTTSKFASMEACANELEKLGNDTLYYQKVKVMGQICPEYYYYDTKYKADRKALEVLNTDVK